jgi:tetratricopeptide (TPR) repeat protein
MLADACVDFAFSWDSLVHADLEAMRGYVTELQRVLRPGGSAFLHHSNLAALAPGSPAVALARKRWRDQTVSAEAIRDAAREAGIHCVAQELVQWACHDFSDAFTLLHKPAGAAPPADPIVAFHPEFGAELQHFGWLESLYGELRPRPEGARRRAGVLLRAGRREASIEELQRLLRLTPGDVEAATWAAALLRQTGRIEEAERVLDAAIRAAPRAPALLRERAWLRHEQDRFADGLADARAAEALLEPPPGDEHACVDHALSVLLDCAGDSAGALEHVSRSLELRPREASLLAHRASLLEKLGRSDEALTAAREALRYEPLNEIARRILADGEPLRGT